MPGNRWSQDRQPNLETVIKSILLRVFFSFIRSSWDSSRSDIRPEGLSDWRTRPLARPCRYAAESHVGGGGEDTWDVTEEGSERGSPFWKSAHEKSSGSNVKKITSGIVFTQNASVGFLLRIVGCRSARSKHRVGLVFVNYPLFHS